MSRAFVHIGAPKTGTTFLQQVLWQQRDRAAAHGLLLPLGSVRDHFRASLDLRGVPEEAPDGVPATGAWTRLVTAAEAHDGDVLVSHEMLALADDAAAARAVADLAAQGREVHVLITARDLGRQLPAIWQEAVKARRDLTFADFMAQLTDPASEFGRYLLHVEDHAAQARRWGADLPAGRVHLVTVPPPGAPRDLLWRRFAGVLGLPPEDFTVDVRSNDSLGLEQVELLRRLNAVLGDRLPWPGRYAAVVRGRFARQVLAGQQGRRIVLGGADLALARDRAAGLVTELRDLPGIHVAGDLDELLVGEPTAGADPREPVPAERLLEVALEATAVLLAAGDEDRARLRRRVRELEAAVAAAEAPARSRLRRLVRRLR